jgi:hypothetical protein
MFSSKNSYLLVLVLVLVPVMVLVVVFVPMPDFLLTQEMGNLRLP